PGFHADNRCETGQLHKPHVQDQASKLDISLNDNCAHSPGWSSTFGPSVVFPPSYSTRRVISNSTICSSKARSVKRCPLGTASSKPRGPTSVAEPLAKQKLRRDP